MYEELDPYNVENERVKAIANAANKRKISIRRAITEIVGPPDVAEGLFAVGTRQTSGLHHPHYAFKRYSRNVPGWHYLEKPGPDERSLLIATKLTRVAIISALFGDINETMPEPGTAAWKHATARPASRLDPSITSRPRPHFGWTPDAFEEDGVKLHALPELINAAPQLSGYIDIIRPSWGDIEPLPEFGIGMYAMRGTGVTIAAINVLGKDLPEITAVTYPNPIN